MAVYLQFSLIFIMQIRNSRMYLQACLVVLQGLLQYFIVIGISSVKVNQDSKTMQCLGFRAFEQSRADLENHVNQ